MMNYEMLDARVDALKDEFLADLKKWISVPSVQGKACADNAPFGADVRRMLDTALETAKGYGFETNDIDGYAGDISMGSGDETMGILAHLDVVPVGDGWTRDPWGAEIVDGKVYGRGTMDDKGPGLCALYAMRAVRECGIPLKHGVRLILGCDEETGMTDMRHYASVKKMPDYGFSPDAEFPIINIEKGGIGLLLNADGCDLGVKSLYAGERCNVVPGTAKAEFDCVTEALKEKVADICKARGFKLFFEGNTLVSEGVSAHAATPNFGKNAAGMLLIALHDLGLGGKIMEGLAALTGLQYTGEALGIAQSDELSGALTCNLGILRYDGSRVTAQLDIRYPICANEDDMLANAKAAAAPYGIAVDSLGSHPPLHVPADHRVVRGLLKVYHEVTGLEAYTIAIGGGTYSRMMPNTVAFGAAFPGSYDVCHMPDECAEIDKMMLSIKVYAHAIATLAGGEIE